MLSLLLSFAAPACVEEQSVDEVAEFQAKSGSFLLSSPPPLDRRPVRVWYHIPEGLDRDSRVLFVLHGSGRTGRDYYEAWVPFSERFRFVLLSPEFSRSFYPRNTDYRWGNVVRSEADPVDGTPVDSNEWSFGVIPSVFDEARRRFGITTPHYSIFGHSAGGQFVHRMLLFQPDDRAEAYVAANSGTYTMPSDRWEYPYGLGGFGAEAQAAMERRIEEALQRRLIVLIGAADTSTVLSAPNMTPQAQAQGSHRFARAELFFSEAEEMARLKGVPFRWAIRVVPDVGHSNAEMAEAALRALAW